MSDADPDPTRVEPTSVFEPDPTAGAVGDETLAGGALPPRVPPPDRRPWIIIGLLALIVALLLVVLLVRDDGDGDDVDTATSTSSTELTTSTTDGSTTSSSATSTTTSTSAPAATVPPAACAAAGADPMTPGAAAETLHDAWVRGDEACAGELATPAALGALFERDGAGAQEEFQGCTEVDEPAPHADCAFTYEGGSTHYKLVFSPTEGWQAFDIEQVAD